MVKCFSCHAEIINAPHSLGCTNRKCKYFNENLIGKYTNEELKEYANQILKANKSMIKYLGKK